MFHVGMAGEALDERGGRGMRTTWGRILLLALQVPGWIGCDDDAGSGPQVAGSMAVDKADAGQPKPAGHASGAPAVTRPAQDAGSAAGSGAMDAGHAQAG